MRLVCLFLLALCALCFAQEWASIEIHDQAGCKNDPVASITYHLNDCFPSDDGNDTYPYRIALCSDTQLSAKMCSDSACTNCVDDPEEVYSIGCEDSDDGSLKTQCSNSELEPAMSGIVVKGPHYDNTDCSGTPYYVMYFKAQECEEGVKHECNDGQLRTFYCDKDDCSGKCDAVESPYSSVCVGNATLGLSERYVCSHNGATQHTLMIWLAVVAIAFVMF